MKLEKLNLHNFRCFEDIEVVFDPNLTVIVGANGAGKTSILEGAAIAISSLFVKMDGLTGKKIEKDQVHLKSYTVGSTKDVQPQYSVTVGASGQVDDQEIKWERSLTSSTGQTTYGDAKEITSIGVEYQKQLRKGDTGLLLPIIAYYGTGRLWDYHREKQSDVFEVNNRLNGYLDCVDGTANIKLMMNWFAKMTIQKYQNQELGMGDIPELNAVYRAMEMCYRRITGYSDIKMQYNVGSKELIVAYKDNDGEFMRMSIDQLSDGYKSTISLVADIAYRMAVLNPQLLDSVCKETEGIVLIDEVDLHLHPAWQQRILGDLQEIFPKVQFIVSTHAPAVVNTIKKQHIRILRNLKIIPAPIETYGRDTNGVLKAIMNAKERPQFVLDAFTEFYQALDDGEYSRAEDILNQLEESVGENYPDLAALWVKLDLAQM